MKKNGSGKVKISEFKARMGEYLQEVRSGHPVVLYDRNTPVATVAPYAREDASLHIRRATKNPQDWMPPAPSKHRLDFMKALDETRQDRF